jgi:hypothetical protein
MFKGPTGAGNPARIGPRGGLPWRGKLAAGNWRNQRGFIPGGKMLSRAKILEVPRQSDRISQWSKCRKIHQQPLPKYRLANPASLTPDRSLATSRRLAGSCKEEDAKLAHPIILR